MQMVLLGTAQWGLDYGITNRQGRLDDNAVRAIVRSAREAGVASLDTAPGYGNAEARILQLAPDFRVQTKLSARGRTDLQLLEALEESRARLGRESLWSVLVHDWFDLEPSEEVRVAGVLERARADGSVARVGVSGYTASDLERALGAFGQLDVVQLPVSVLDQRLEGSAAVADLRERGGVLQARSVLLQGVASGESSAFSDHPDVTTLVRTGRPLELCMAYIHSRDWADEVVLGVTTAPQLQELLLAWRTPVEGIDWSALASRDEQLLDPRTWESMQ